MQMPVVFCPAHGLETAWQGQQFMKMQQEQYPLQPLEAHVGCCGKERHALTLPTFFFHAGRLPAICNQGGRYIARHKYFY